MLEQIQGWHSICLLLSEKEKCPIDSCIISTTQAREIQRLTSPLYFKDAKVQNPEMFFLAVKEKKNNTQNTF